MYNNNEQFLWHQAFEKGRLQKNGSLSQKWSATDFWYTKKKLQSSVDWKHSINPKIQGPVLAGTIDP